MLPGRRWIATCAAVAAACLLSACGGGSDHREMRSTSFGVVKGVDDRDRTGTVFWKGIPFAKAPVDDLRWQAPVAPDPWATPLDATEFGAPCIQNGRIYGPGLNNRYDDTIAQTLNQPVGSEDCLTLNIWRPRSDERGLPVIVFVYGGSNISGYTADPTYDGANLAKAANAVVVTMNYRVGVLGFFGMEQLKAGNDDAGDSGNFALLDIVKALAFVRSDIESFGGDPSNVTLMGQSAGAINVWALMTSPLADQLFHKTVPISGGISTAATLPAGTVPTILPVAVHAIPQADRLLYEMLIADAGVPAATDLASAQAVAAAMTDAQVAEYMRAQDAGALLTTVLTKLGPVGLGGSGPIPDGTVLPADPIAAIQSGQYHAVPVLAGNTRDEGKLFGRLFPLFFPGLPSGYRIDDAELFRTLATYDPNAPHLTNANIISDPYLPVDTPATGWTARAEIIDQVFMTANAVDVMNAVKSRQQDVWYYRFDWDQEPAPWNDVYGAAHAFDLPFIFGTWGPSLFSNGTNSAANEPGRLALSNAMMQTIAAFARTGNPNNAAVPDWPAWPAGMVFDATNDTVDIQVDPNPTLP